MFLDWKKQHCENDYTTQSNLQIQRNPYQSTTGWASLVVQWLGVCLANAGDTGSGPGLGGSHMPWSNQARAPQRERPPQ